MVQLLVHAPDVVRSQARCHRLNRLALPLQQQPGAIRLQRNSAIRVPCRFRKTVKLTHQALLPGSLLADKQGSEAGVPPLKTETLRSDPEWNPGSFPLGESGSHRAYKSSIEDNAFRTVKIPGEVQLQTCLKRNDLFMQSKSLSLINNQEWWSLPAFRLLSGIHEPLCLGWN